MEWSMYDTQHLCQSTVPLLGGGGGWGGIYKPAGLSIKYILYKVLLENHSQIPYSIMYFTPDLWVRVLTPLTNHEINNIETLNKEKAKIWNNICSVFVMNRINSSVVLFKISLANVQFSFLPAKKSYIPHFQNQRYRKSYVLPTPPPSHHQLTYFNCFIMYIYVQ
jgi:hypothetical protein